MESDEGLHCYFVANAVESDLMAIFLQQPPPYHSHLKFCVCVGGGGGGVWGRGGRYGFNALKGCVSTMWWL